MQQTVEQLNSQNAVYQLTREGVDVPAMVDRAQARLWSTRKSAVKEALASSVWGDQFPSLKSYPYRGEYRRRFSQCRERIDPFEAQTGAIHISVDHLAISPLGKFFTPQRARNLEQLGDVAQLRHFTYYTALDEGRDTPRKKLEVMSKDIEEGVRIIGATDRSSLEPVDFLLYLGILDHIKVHSLTAFNALTFPERAGFVPEDPDYLLVREIGQEVMSTCTRAFYQACLGRSFDEQFSLASVAGSFDLVADYIANNDYSIAHFTLPEVINPITIMLGSHEAANKKPYPDTIIGIPSGGTEVAVVTALMYEALYPEVVKPDMVFIPLSFHYKAQGGISIDQLVVMLTQSSNMVGKRALIVDDNSNTGSTLQKMSEAVIKAGAAQVSAHLAEIDPIRVMIKHSKRGEIEDFGVVNMDHQDFETAIGISGASAIDGADLRRKLIRKLLKNAHRQHKKEKKRTARELILAP